MLQITTIGELVNRLDEVRDRVQRNIPKHSKPDAFHEEKSEIARELNAIMEALVSARMMVPVRMNGH